MSELRYLWLFAFISLPASLFLEADNIKEGFARAFFVAGIIAVITVLLRAIFND